MAKKAKAARAKTAPARKSAPAKAKRPARQAAPAPGDRRMKKPDATSATSQAPALDTTEPEVVTYERLGKLQRWSVPKGPYSDNKNYRATYVGGFLTRTQQWNQGTLDQGIPDRFGANAPLQRIFEDGYNDAARQDGGNLKPRVLSGSTTEAAPRARRRG